MHMCINGKIKFETDQVLPNFNFTNIAMMLETPIIMAITQAQTSGLNGIQIVLSEPNSIIAGGAKNVSWSKR